MRQVLRWCGQTMLVVLVIAGLIQIWDLGRWAVSVAEDWQGKAGVSNRLAVGETLGPGGSSAMTVVVLANQPPLPGTPELIDNDYSMNTAFLVKLGRAAIMKRLKEGEVQRPGKFLVACEPGQEACLYVPVSTASVPRGWRPIRLKDTVCVFAVPPVKEPVSPGSLVAKQ